jgi:DNA-binding MurR/RpiR family transcriptional regulator
MTLAAAEPDVVADLLAAGGLSPQLRRAARYLAAHPDHAAVQSMRMLAGAAGVTPATMVRLAQALGLAGYPELKQRFVARLVPALPYAAKAEALQQAGDAATIYERSFAAQNANLEATRLANGAAVLEAAAAALEGARRVWIAGFRGLYPIAFHAHYVWGFFRSDLFLAASPGGMLDNAMFGVGRDDALLVMSVTPYSRDALRAAEMAAEARATIVALTDGTTSPLARQADHLLVCATDTPSFFHSLTAASATIETLLAVLARNGGKSALAAIRRAQRRLVAMGTYVEPGAAPKVEP